MLTVATAKRSFANYFRVPLSAAFAKVNADPVASSRPASMYGAPVSYDIGSGTLAARGYSEAPIADNSFASAINASTISYLHAGQDIRYFYDDIDTILYGDPEMRLDAIVVKPANVRKVAQDLGWKVGEQRSDGRYLVHQGDAKAWMTSSQITGKLVRYEGFSLAGSKGLIRGNAYTQNAADMAQIGLEVGTLGAGGGAGTTTAIGFITDSVRTDLQTRGKISAGTYVEMGLEAAPLLGEIPGLSRAMDKIFGGVQKAAESVPVSGFSPRGVNPAPGTRVRPEGIPDTWRIRPTDEPGGVWYYDPTNPAKGDAVRVMQGKLTNPHPNSQAPYVRWQRNGQALDVNGNVVPKRTPDAHIPLPEFQFNPEVFGK